MKYIYISKRYLFYIPALILITILFIIFIIPNKNTTNKSMETFKPLDTIKNNSIDLNADGVDETLNIVTKNNNDDIEIISNNHTYYLSSLCKNNLLSTHSSFWPINIYIQSLSRNLYPDIIVQGNINNKPVNYIFTWGDNEFIKVLDDDKNIFGLLDINSNKTPKCYTLDSFSGLSSFYSFMVINKKALDITSNTKLTPDIDMIQNFINIIEKNYELTELPNIFVEGIPQDDLRLIWNLDKENNTYSFQNGFFYDETSDIKGNAATYKWNLNFEKYSSYNNSKSQITIYLITQKTDDNSYKISSFYIK